jgi:hypothetical protein
MLRSLPSLCDKKQIHPALLAAAAAPSAAAAAASAALAAAAAILAALRPYRCATQGASSTFVGSRAWLA